MLITTLIGIQTACVVTSTAYLGYKLGKRKIKLDLYRKEGKFKHYHVR